MKESSDSRSFKSKKVVRKDEDLRRSTWIVKKAKIFLPVDSKEIKSDEDLNEDNEKTFGKNLYNVNSLSF